MALTATKDIIVIGGSAGSSGPLKRLLADLPADLPASVFISTHIPAHSPSFLAEVLSGGATLPVRQAVDGQPIERGQVYVAAPDRHLLLIDGVIKLGAGPRENMVRPTLPAASTTSHAASGGTTATRRHPRWAGCDSGGHRHHAGAEPPGRCPRAGPL